MCIGCLCQEASRSNGVLELPVNQMMRTALLAAVWTVSCGGETTHTDRPPASGCPESAVEVDSKLGTFCIDRTEVTGARYSEFLKEPPQSQPAFCKWNESYVPTAKWPTASPETPVTFVDWCDARAYCEWAGGDLCGGAEGSTLDYSDGSDPNASRWMAACSHDGERAYPYGDKYQPTACRGEGQLAPVVAGSLPICEGGFTGMFDLSGNVGEWENACDQFVDRWDTCNVRGGAFSSSGAELSCGAWAYDNRFAKTEAVEIRCCYELP